MWRSIIVATTTLIVIVQSIDTTFQLEKLTFKATYVRDGEKNARVRLSADMSTVDQVADTGDVHVESSDTISVQASIVDASGESVGIEQAFIRFLNKRTGVDNLYLMRKTGLDIKVDVNLAREIRADHDFWVGTDTYRTEVVLGDERLKSSKTWVVTDSLRFKDQDASDFKPAPRGVFDFDVSVKKHLLPEFEFPIPPKEKRAPFSIVMIALIAVIVPLPLLLITWKWMGVLPLSLPSGHQLFVAGGLHFCVLAHIAILIGFWLSWNIVTTWKIMSVIMVPTLVFIRFFLREDHESKR